MSDNKNIFCFSFFPCCNRSSRSLRFEGVAQTGHRKTFKEEKQALFFFNGYHRDASEHTFKANEKIATSIQKP